MAAPAASEHAGDFGSLAEFKAHCAHRWPDDYVAQLACIEEQRPGAAEVAAFVADMIARKDGSGMERMMILGRCQSQAFVAYSWDDHHTYDYVIKAASLARETEQMEAKEALDQLK